MARGSIVGRYSSESSRTLVAVGDIMLDRRLRPPRIFMHQPDAVECAPGFASHFRIPYENSLQSRNWLKSRNQSIYGLAATSHFAHSMLLEDIDAESPDYPFLAMRDCLSSADAVIGNLECPLSDRGRPTANDACYSASPAYAAAMQAASFKVLSVANNHTFDFGEIAFLDTLDELRAHGIAPIGGGRDLDEAREPAYLDLQGLRLAMLGYSMVGEPWVYAVSGESGIAPLNPMIAQEDIERARTVADVVIVSVHWGHELRSVPVPRLVELGHYLIDCGADVVLGHHPHVAGSIEVYKARPIVYSLGNFIFGHHHDTWSTSMVVRLEIHDARIRALHAAGLNGGFQPALLSGTEARVFENALNNMCTPFSVQFRPLDEVWSYVELDEGHD